MSGFSGRLLPAFMQLALAFACTPVLAQDMPFGHDSTWTAVHDSLEPRKETVHSPWREDPPGLLPSDVCPEPVETALECFRGDSRLAPREIGFPGARAELLSRSLRAGVPFKTPFFPLTDHSPYIAGGILPPQRTRLQAPGRWIEAVEEVWTPVIPLDTPVTRLHWGRGAMGLNQFHFNLRRMLSQRSYLSLDYFTNTADSLLYDYQFVVHQPYLNGLGLGWAISSLDRDSASLVIQGRSHSIDALNFRPRFGLWLDDTKVLELFLDRYKNTSSITRPLYSESDSTQILLPASMESYTTGAVYAGRDEDFHFEMQYGHSAFTEKVFHPSAHLTAGAPDSLGPGDQAPNGNAMKEDGALDRFSIFHQRHSTFGAPRLSFEAVNEVLNSGPHLSGPVDESRLAAGSSPSGSGWADWQKLGLGLSPSRKGLDAESDIYGVRHSLMDGRVLYFWNYGLSGNASLPWGLSLGSGFGSRTEVPKARRMYRYNPVLGLYPNPRLKEQTTRNLQGSLSLDKGWLRVESGFDLGYLQGSQLPRILPHADACGRIQGSAYSGVGPEHCNEITGAVPDSLALGFVNYDTEQRHTWHADVRFQLGYWNLNLGTSRLWRNLIRDARLKEPTANPSLPLSIYHGHLGWKRPLLANRLKVSVGWDWQWFSHRREWASHLNGSSDVVKLDEYLVLDFMAGMEIRQFLLYFKVMNLNHDRYYPEPGVLPPGVNFRFGIDWRIRN